jgi:hypothetical protein
MPSARTCVCHGSLPCDGAPSNLTMMRQPCFPQPGIPAHRRVYHIFRWAAPLTALAADDFEKCHYVLTRATGRDPPPRLTMPRYRSQACISDQPFDVAVSEGVD